MWKRSALAVALMALASSAVAGELTPLVGTDAWIEVPPGFTIGHGVRSNFVLYNEDGTAGVTASQSHMPNSARDEIFKAPLTAEQLPMFGQFLPGGMADIRIVNGKQWLIVAAKMPNGPGQMWLVIPAWQPSITMSVLALDSGGDPNAAGAKLVDGVLRSFAVSRPQITTDGIDFGGLHLPAVAPFTFGQISETGMARLYTIAPDQAPDGPKTYINLQFVAGNAEASTLEQIGDRWLKYFDDSKVESSEERSILGEPALRQTWSGTSNGKPQTVLGYIGSYGGQPFIVSAIIPSEQATPDLVAAFDQIATSITLSKNVPIIGGDQQ
jgi:hypothetical protein